MEKTISIMAIAILCIFATNILCAAGQVYHTKAGYLVLATEADLDRAMGFIADKDNAALNEMGRRGRVSNLIPGEAVYVEKRTWSGKVKIRPVGMIGTVWTVMEAIE